MKYYSPNIMTSSPFHQPNCEDSLVNIEQAKLENWAGKKEGRRIWNKLITLPFCAAVQRIAHHIFFTLSVSFSFLRFFLTKKIFLKNLTSSSSLCCLKSSAMGTRSWKVFVGLLISVVGDARCTVCTSQALAVSVAVVVSCARLNGGGAPSVGG